MNLLLLDPEDFTDDGRVVVRGRRADHLVAVVRPQVGQRLAIGRLNGPKGYGVVREVSGAALVLEPHLEGEVEPPPAIDLLLALPRPKVLRRCLADLAALGVGRIDITNAWRVERSYFSSPVLEPGAIDAALRIGLEQGGATRLPLVTVYPRLMAFLDNTLPGLGPGHCLLAHPKVERRLGPADVAGERLLIAVGPEGGWIEREVETFIDRGFTPFTLGPRVLRTETAIPAIWGAVHALRTG